MKISRKIKEDFSSLLQNKYKHKEIPNFSLIPENDPSVLFTTAGMQPIVPYLLGEKHPLGKRLTNIQRCFRTVDIDEVGDTIHHTFFEMLGFWSLGDYFKELSLDITFDFFVNVMKFDPNRLFVTVFVGNNDVAIDIIAINKWKELFKSVGIDADEWDGKTFTSTSRIFPLDQKENWWGPAGETGPCGPDSEFFYWRGKGTPSFKKYVPWDNSNMFIEISNNVFMGFNKNLDSSFTPLKKKNIDFGSGFERVVLIKQLKEQDGSIDIKKSVYDTELFDTQRLLLEQISNLSLQSDDELVVKNLRIILDHVRASVFLICDGVMPSNKDQGYILRRLIRRVMRCGKSLNINKPYITELALSYIKTYKTIYTHLDGKNELVSDVLTCEMNKFNKTLDNGLKILNDLKSNNKQITGKDLFNIYETYGFPCELSLEVLQFDKKTESILLRGFEKSFEDHKKLSRTMSQGKFKGGLVNDSFETTKLHTLQHVFLRGLQELIDSDIHQKGSNINSQRFRIDINLDKKLSDDQIKLIEDKTYKVIKMNLPVERFDLEKSRAITLGAEHEFTQKYGEVVSIYFIGLKKKSFLNLGKDDYFSAEFCGGPHVKNTKEILSNNEKFKVFFQENIGNGVIRIKAGIVKC